MAGRFTQNDGILTKVREQNKAMVRRVLNLLSSSYYEQGEYVTHGPIYDALMEIDSDSIKQLESIAKLDESKQKQMLFVVLVRELQPLKSVENYERFIRTLVKLVEQYGEAWHLRVIRKFRTLTKPKKGQTLWIGRFWIEIWIFWKR